MKRSTSLAALLAAAALSALAPAPAEQAQAELEREPAIAQRYLGV